jgi:hypothetical protein
MKRQEFQLKIAGAMAFLNIALVLDLPILLIYNAKNNKILLLANTNNENLR